MIDEWIISEGQYKRKINWWKLDKNVKSKEMQHVIRIQNEERRENPAKRSDYYIRGHLIMPSKIDRFKREHSVVAKIDGQSGNDVYASRHGALIKLIRWLLL